MRIDKENRKCGYVLSLVCEQCDWRTTLDPQQPLWLAWAKQSEHDSHRHAPADQAIARAQARKGYDTKIVDLELPGSLSDEDR